MSAKDEQRQFEPLPMRRRSLAEVDASQYCIWTATGEMQEIKADTAYEAVMKSGHKSIIKIERVFNIRQNLIDQSLLKEEPPASAGSGEDTESIHDRINRRRNPIISASELDELMRSLQKEALSSEEIPLPAPDTMAEQNLPSAQVVTEANAAHAEPDTTFRPPVPPPQEMPASSEAVSAVGLDVHNDGFDEIIPAASQIKAPAPKPHHEAKETPIAQPAAVSPQTEAKELSAEEVEKLLQSKPE